MGPKTSLFILLLLSVTLGVRSDRPALPGSTTAGGGDVVPVTFWNGFTGPDGRTMLGIVRGFNDANPDVHVAMQRMDWATYYNKLIVAAVDGRGPEVFVVHASTLARMRRAGFIDAVDDLYGPSGVPRDDFDPQAIEQVAYDGHLVGVPLDLHPQGLYGNARLLRTAGFVDESGAARLPRDRDEFLAAARQAMTDEDGDGRPETWGYALTNWRWNFMSLLPQFGGRYFDDAGRCALDDPANVAALEFLTSLRRDHGLVPDPETGLGWVGFRQQKVAMVFDGVFMLGDLLRLNDLECIAAPMPRIGPYPGTLADAHVLCVRAGLDPARRAAAGRFVRFLSDHSLEWAAAGQVPARRSVRESEGFRAMPVQYQFSLQVPYVMFPPRTPALFELQLELDLAVEKAFRGRATPAEALRVASANVQAFIDREGLHVDDPPSRRRAIRASGTPGDVEGSNNGGNAAGEAP
jgi:multiple sugar transport system substrate-binding protein